jgi:hypothetical protein
MTPKQIAFIRARWRGQSVETCRHLSLELEFSDQGDSTGNYVCIVCGELVAQRSLAVCTDDASSRTK